MGSEGIYHNLRTFILVIYFGQQLFKESLRDKQLLECHHLSTYYLSKIYITIWNKLNISIHILGSIHSSRYNLIINSAFSFALL